jgi:hypothetical protein
MHDPIAYTYEAAHHCPGCTFERFGQDENGFPPESARDSEGNSIGALAPWDEWYDVDSDEGGVQVLVCDDCGGTIDTYGEDVEPPCHDPRPDPVAHPEFWTE